MEVKKHYQQMEKYQEHKLEDQKIEENYRLRDKQQSIREQYLKKLKQGAMTIDYGAHDIFMKNYQKNLLQRKQEEWKNDQIYASQSKYTNQYENLIKNQKKNARVLLADDLKRQIIEKEHYKK